METGDFWSQFWPQFWGGVASGLFLAFLTALFAYLTRLHIARFVSRLFEHSVRAVRDVEHIATSHKNPL